MRGRKGTAFEGDEQEAERERERAVNTQGVPSLAPAWTKREQNSDTVLFG
jgi:hypothetical protein